MMMFLMCMVMAVLIPGKTAQAASTKSKNTAAYKAYQKKIEKLAKENLDDWSNSCGVQYYYLDVTGDGVDELFVTFHKKMFGSADAVRFYTYKKNKLECILATYIYGLSDFNYYKKTKSLYFSSYGHGDEVHTYFKLSKGKYKKVAGKYRDSEKGGHWENGPWYYSNGSGKKITSSKYKKLVKNLPKGSKKKVKWDKFNKI